MLALLPDVEGRDVLDAGCGPGVYAEALVARGARVVGLDSSPTMLALAEKRLAGRAQFLWGNLDLPLTMFSDGSFDVVVSALALDHVRDWDALFAGFYRILRQGGHVVFSVQHPCSDYVLSFADDYMQTELYQQRWRSLDPKLLVPTYRRPLHAILDPLLRAGFTLDRLHEPVPTAQFREQFPEQYERLMRRPDFMMIKGKKG
jgi:ubiquinone/menaquinone biosynthesis C-methylase UbiE